jgi:hypothetical protein
LDLDESFFLWISLTVIFDQPNQYLQSLVKQDFEDIGLVCYGIQSAEKNKNSTKPKL